MSSPFDVVIAAAGSGERLRADRPKAFVDVGGEPLLAPSLRAAARIGARRIMVTVPAEDEQRWGAAIAALQVGPGVATVPGGATRQASVHAGLEALRSHAADAGQEPPTTVLVHDAARPRATDGLWRRVLAAAAATGAAVPVLPSIDSLKRIDADGNVAGSLERDRIVRAQTPQGFRFDWLLRAHETGAGAAATDDAALVERLGHRVATVAGEEGNLKVTTAADVAALSRAAFMVPRVGYGYDVHPLAAGRRLVLGGVEIEYDRGLMGHSDADALAHAITDALLGAAGMGDIGQKFPAEDPRWEGADSIELLAAVVADLAAAGFRPLNVDATVVAEQPRLAPHLERMRMRLAGALGLGTAAVNVKATRGEGIGSIGRGEGIAAHAVAMVGGV